MSYNREILVRIDENSYVEGTAHGVVNELSGASRGGGGGLGPLKNTLEVGIKSRGVWINPSGAGGSTANSLSARLKQDPAQKHVKYLRQRCHKFPPEFPCQSKLPT